MNAENNRYKISHLIGEGRAGVVYKATDTILDRAVAIRRFPGCGGDSEYCDKWRAEFMDIISALSRVSHSSLVRVIDGGIDDVGPYIITSFCEGKLVFDLELPNNKFEVSDAHDLLTQVLDSLVSAEKEGFYHYALGPNSVFAMARHTPGYNYTLVDLGHSRMMPLVLGTDFDIEQAYNQCLIAPELYEKKPEGIRTSQYTLAQLVYWLLVGEHPFEKLTMLEAYKRHANGLIPKLTEIRPDVKGDLAEWFSVALDPKVGNRFPTLQEAIDALPEPSKRIYGQKKVMPPKAICEEDINIVP